MKRVYLVAVWLWGSLPLILTYRWFRGGDLRSGTGAALLAFTVLWWAAALGLLGRRSWAPGLATVLAGIPLLLGLGQSVRRVLFVVNRGGLDAVGGQGSPLAFLVGWGEEAAVLLIPGLVLTALGAREWTKRLTLPPGAGDTPKEESTA